MAACLAGTAPISCNPAISAIAATESDGGNRGENIKTPGEDGITGDRALDLDIEVGDRTSGKRSNPQGDTRYPPRAPPLSQEAPDVEFATANFSVNWMRQRRWCLG